MPAGPRIRSNNQFGLITDNPLTAVATTFNSARLSLFPVVSSAHAVVTLDPRALNGEPEIIIITAHTAAATVATITRGAYGTVARSHPLNTEWVHAPLDEDVIEILTSSTRPSDPYRGQAIFETDTNRYVGRSTADAWQDINLFSDAPSCRVFNNATQSVGSGATVTLGFNSERFDNNAMHDTAVNNSRITINVPGVYVVTAHVRYDAEPTGDLVLAAAFLIINGTTVIANHDVGGINSAVIGAIFSVSTIYKFAAAEFIQVQTTQTNGNGEARNVQASNGHQCEFSATWVSRG